MLQAQTPVPAVVPSDNISHFSTSINPLRIQGACYASWQTPNVFLTPASDMQLRRLKEAGTNWIALRVTWSQEGYNTWEIAPNFATPTDESIAHVVRECHRLGMKVMLALMVDFADDNRGGTFHWWGQIAPGDQINDANGKPVDPAEGWQRWFTSYETFLLRYARVAQNSDADMLCIGNEFVTASLHEQEWRKLIGKTRGAFKGPLTYQAHFASEYNAIKFWDALDYIGLNGYWLLSEELDPTFGELLTGLQVPRKALRDWYATLPEKSRKPILFTEVGYHSADGTAKTPWARNSLNALPNPDLQKRCFAAFLQTFAADPMVAGFFWWVECPPDEWGIDERGAGHPFLGKPAEQILRDFAKSEKMRVNPISLSPPKSETSNVVSQGMAK